MDRKSAHRRILVHTCMEACLPLLRSTVGYSGVKPIGTLPTTCALLTFPAGSNLRPLRSHGWDSAAQSAAGATAGQPGLETDASSVDVDAALLAAATSGGETTAAVAGWLSSRC